MPEIICWSVTDGSIGMENQAVGVAEALGLTPVIKRIRLRTPWRQLIPHLRIGLRYAFDPAADPIAPPWPDLLIGTGRQSVAASLAARRYSRGHTVTVQIQDPMIDPAYFDLVVVPQHDRLRGANVLVTRGAPHRVTAARLAEAATHFTSRFAALPPPRIAVLIGGSNGVYTVTPAIIAELCDQLCALQATTGASLLVTSSRRTGEANRATLRQRLHSPDIVLWDGTGENPYFGLLALADAIIATSDSVSMISEACFTGKPVYVVNLDGGSRKFARFHETFRNEGYTRPFTGTLDPDWQPPPLNDMPAIAAAIRQRLAARPT